MKTSVFFPPTHNTDYNFTLFISFQLTLSTVTCCHWNILCDNDADLTHKHSTPDPLGGLFSAMCGVDAFVGGGL